MLYCVEAATPSPAAAAAAAAARPAVVDEGARESEEPVPASGHGVAAAGVSKDAGVVSGKPGQAASAGASEEGAVGIMMQPAQLEGGSLPPPSSAGGTDTDKGKKKKKGLFGGLKKHWQGMLGHKAH